MVDDEWNFFREPNLYTNNCQVQKMLEGALVVEALKYHLGADHCSVVITFGPGAEISCLAHPQNESILHLAKRGRVRFE